MTKENTDFQEPDVAEIKTFKITSTRVIEMDFAAPQLQSLLHQTDAESEAEAVETVLLERERQFIDPEQKLLGAEVEAVVNE